MFNKEKSIKAMVIVITSVIAAKSKRNCSDFCKMKAWARFSSYRVSGSDYVKTFKSWPRIFKQRTRRLGKSRILPFATHIYSVKV